MTLTPHERILRLAMATVANRKLIQYTSKRRFGVPRATIGRIVHYRVCEDDWTTKADGSGGLPRAVGHAPSPSAQPGEYAPAMVVGTYPDYEKVAQAVDLQVFVGVATIFVKGSVEGSTPGTWCWPPKQ